MKWTVHMSKQDGQDGDKPTWQLQKEDEVLVLALGGMWCTMALQYLENSSLLPGHTNVIDGSGLRAMDTTGALWIHRLIESMTAKGGRPLLRGFSKAHMKLLEWGKPFCVARPSLRAKEPIAVRVFVEIGSAAVHAIRSMPNGIAFLGQLVVSLLNMVWRPRSLRVSIIVDQLSAVGVRAVPIVSLISFLIGVVLTFQGAFQLRRFGAEIFTVDLLAVSILRELGVLLTAIVVAGRTGSAFAAQIGTMKLNQEIDALHVMNISVMEFLVIPRIVALVIALPLLAFLANAIALLGGCIMSFVLLDITHVQFVKQLQQSLTAWTFWIGIIKAPFFAFLIAMVGCYEGLKVSGSAESIGQRTTKAVVEGIFLVIVCDALFSILFSMMGI